MRGVLGSILAVLLLSGCGAQERIRAGDNYMEAERYAAAGRAYGKAADRRRRSSRALEGAAAAWLADGDPEQALFYARRAAAQADSGLALLAAVLIDLGRGKEAVPLLEEAPLAPGQDRWLAEALLSTGQLDAALTAAGRAEPDEGGELAGLLGWLSARQGRDEDALSIAHRTRGAASPQAQADVAAIFRMLGDDTVIEVEAERHIKQWWASAALMLEANEHEAALRRFMWLWVADPADGRAARHAGELLVTLEEFDVARHALTDALAVDDTDPSLWQTLARACFAMEDWSCSAAARSRYLDLSASPTVADWVLGARAWRAAGSMPDLIAMWERAIKRQPDTAALYYHLSGSLLEAKRVDEAIGYARLAWQLALGDPEVALLLGGLYSSRQEYEAAADIYRVALESSPSDSRLHASLKTVLGYIQY